jgi:hypothetical protein
MKIHPVDAKLFMQRKDRQPGTQADMTKLTVAFHNFVNMPNNVST